MQNVGYPSLCHFSEVMARKQLIEMQKKKRQGTSVCLYLISVHIYWSLFAMFHFKNDVYSNNFK